MKPPRDMGPDANGKYGVSVNADGYPDDMTAPLFPVVGFIDWNNPRLRRLGKQFAEQAHILADELHSCGADPEQLLLDWRQRRARSFMIEVQPELLDIVAAVLLSLPRPKERRGPRSRWSIKSVEAMIESGVSVRAAAKAEAARTGVSWATVERTTRAWRARHKQGGEK
jgi:hypothetical protein